MALHSVVLAFFSDLIFRPFEFQAKTTLQVKQQTSSPQVCCIDALAVVLVGLFCIPEVTLQTVTIHRDIEGLQLGQCFPCSHAAVRNKFLPEVHYLKLE